MRKTILFFLLFIAKDIYSQKELKFESLKLNSSPAYNVLGVDPQNIQRPGTPTDFIAGVQSAVVNGKLQPNFAMETTPYYWKHPKDDNDKKVSLWNFLRAPNSIPENFLRTFTLSFATSESDTTVFGKLLPGTGLGVGFKFNLFNGSIRRKTQVELGALIGDKLIWNLYNDIKNDLVVGNPVNIDNKINTWKNHKKNGDADLDRLVDWIADNVRKSINKDILNPADTAILNKLLRKVNALESDRLTGLNKATFPLTREGFMLEVAFANSSVVQNNEWSNIANAKTALWVTPSWRFNTRKDPTVVDILDVMAVIRMTWNSRMTDSSDYFDIGGRVQYTHNKLSFSGEYVARRLTDKPGSVQSAWTNRLDLSLDYKVNDFITFKATFGRNFDGNSVHYSDPSKMFAVGGFNFGFGNLLPKSN